MIDWSHDSVLMGITEAFLSNKRLTLQVVIELHALAIKQIVSNSKL